MDFHTQNNCYPNNVCPIPICCNNLSFYWDKNDIENVSYENETDNPVFNIYQSVTPLYSSSNFNSKSLIGNLFVTTNKLIPFSTTKISYPVENNSYVITYTDKNQIPRGTIFFNSTLLSYADFSSITNSINKSSLIESFDTGLKKEYITTTEVKLKIGSITLNNAILNYSGGFGNENNVRMTNKGYLRMEFDINLPVKQICISHNSYSNDKLANFSVYYSTDSGTTWLAIGTPITTSSTLTTTCLSNPEPLKPIRFKIQHNVEVFNFVDYRLLIKSIKFDIEDPDFSSKSLDNNLFKGYSKILGTSGIFAGREGYVLLNRINNKGDVFFQN